MKRKRNKILITSLILSVIISSLTPIGNISVSADEIIDGITVSTSAPNLSNFEQKFESDWVDVDSKEDAFNQFKSQIQALNCDYVYIQTSNTTCYHYYQYDHGVLYIVRLI